MSLRATPELPIKAVIFDLDGVLVSSIPLHYEAFRRTFGAEGVEFAYEDYVELGVGAPREILIRRVMGEGLEEARFQRLMSEKVRHVREILERDGLAQIPGAREFAESVRNRGLRSAVATASRTSGLLLAGAGMQDLFEAVVDRNDVEKPKPAPDIFLLAAERLEVEPGRCLVLEDSPLGVQAGVSAGMHVIALTTSEPPDRLGAAHAIVESYDEIALDDWLRGGG